MDVIINYFSEMPTLHRSILLIGGLTIFFLIENAAPLFSMKTYSRTKHTGLNIFFTATTILVNLSMAFLLVKTAQWVATTGFGVMNWMSAASISIWLTAIVGLLLMDLVGAWLAHYVEHHVKWMWQFHVVHHTDQHVDTTTANRHHPGESVIRYIFTLVAVIVTGAPVWMIFLYQSLSLILSQFNHSNISMPKWLDNALVLIVCTPNMHRVHHHYRQPYSDTNYGNIFSIWDRVFGTYAVVDNEKLVYGVDTHMKKDEISDIGYLLKIPFLPYRPHIKYEEEESL